LQGGGGGGRITGKGEIGVIRKEGKTWWVKCRGDGIKMVNFHKRKKHRAMHRQKHLKKARKPSQNNFGGLDAGPGGQWIKLGTRLFIITVGVQ